MEDTMNCEFCGSDLSDCTYKKRIDEEGVESKFFCNGPLLSDAVRLGIVSLPFNVTPSEEEKKKIVEYGLCSEVYGGQAYLNGRTVSINVIEK